MESYSVTITSSLASITIGIKKPFILHTPLKGWGRASIRTSSFNNSGADGGQITEQYYGMRQIPLEFTLIGTTCEDHDLQRINVENSLPIREDVTVTLRTPQGRVYGTTARVIDVAPDIINHTRTEYAVELRSADPLLYDYTGGSSLIANVSRTSAGGFVLPAVMPIVFGAGSLPTAVTNSGTVTVKPLITLTGSAINPIITNQTTGQFIKLNLTMVEGDEVIIDTATQKVTLNGGNIRNSVDVTSDFWYLPPGVNNILLDSTSTSDTVTAAIEWFNGYLSI